MRRSRPRPMSIASPPPHVDPVTDRPDRFARARRLLASARALLSEQPVLDALPRGMRVTVVRRIAQQEAARIGSSGWILVPIALLLGRVDLARIDAGVFTTSWVWPTLAAIHVVIGLTAIPALIIAHRRRREPFLSSKPLQGTFLWMLGCSTMAVALLGVRYRETAFEFNISLVALNLVYYTPPRIRVAWTLGATLTAILMVPAPDVHLSAAHTALVNEIIVTALAYVSIANFAGRQRIQSVRLEQELFALAHLDALTGVASRRRVEEGLAAALAGRRADLGPGRPSRPLPASKDAAATTSVILLDLDHFKSVNDAHGHPIGDAFLAATARVLQQRVRLDDIVGRWGGEEFLVVCPGTTLAEATALAESLRQRIATRDFPDVGHRTASFGVAAAQAGDTPETLIARADAALYAAKRAGRDRVIAAP